MKTTKQSKTGAAALLPLADLIQGCARRLENMATWRDGYLSNIVLSATGQRELENRLAELETLVKNRRQSA